MSQNPSNVPLEVQHKISILKEIIDKQKCEGNTLEELKYFLLDTNLQNIPVDIWNTYIFNAAVSYAHENLCEIIKNINNNVKNKKNLDFLNESNQSNALVNLLKCWDLYIHHLSVLENICIIDIKNFPTYLFDTMIEILNCFKIWAKDYGKQSVSIIKFLTSVFHQCINILNLFYDLLDLVISFDTKQETEMEILCKIIDNSGKLATLVTDMDSKTLMDMWKHFGKLVIKYSVELKSISPNTIIYHVKGLTKSIVGVLSCINPQSPSERPIFCCRVLIIILEKLCDAFDDWISNDVMNEIVILITKLYMYTEQNLKLNSYSSQFIKFVSTNFTIVFEPFIDVIFKNENLKTSLFNYGKNINDNLIGYHLLLLIIIKKISTLPWGEQREWYNKEHCILDACFRNIDIISENICVGKLKIQMLWDIAQKLYMTNIYEATCLSISGLICQISSSDFSQLILLLLRYLLNGKFFSSLLSSDVWCFICRLGSSEMCYSHFKYLIQIYEMLRGRKYNLNVVMLYNLIRRQYNFLLDTDKTDLMNNFIDISDPYVWSSFGQLMDTEEKKFLQAKINISTLNGRISTNLKGLNNEPSLNNLSTLIEDLTLIEASGVSQDEQLVNIFTKMWNKLLYIISDCEGPVLNVVEDFAIYLLRSTHPQPEQVTYLTLVLESMVMIYPYASTGLRLEFCRSFCRFTESLDDWHKSVVADLMYRMLNDDNLCVQQQAFESFELMTLVCQSVDVVSFVAVTVKDGRSELSTALFEYIGGHVHDINLDDFFINLCSFGTQIEKHVCHNKSERNWKKIPKIKEPITTTTCCESKDFEDLADKVCTSMEQMLKLKRHLKEDTYYRLRLLCTKFIDEND